MKLFQMMLAAIFLAGCCSLQQTNNNPPCELVANDTFLQSCLVFRTTTNWVERQEAAVQCGDMINTYLFKTREKDLTFGGVQALLGKGMRYENKENALVYHVPTEEKPDARVEFIYLRPEIVYTALYWGWSEDY
ncbi:MAG: hypothetical protein ACOX5G_09305 [Kiritimatiellia bacterium]